MRSYELISATRNALTDHRSTSPNFGTPLMTDQSVQMMRADNKKGSSLSLDKPKEKKSYNCDQTGHKENHELRK